MRYTRANARSFRLALLASVISGLCGCTLEPLPLHPTQVQVARNQSKPLKTGPSAPGTTRVVWDLTRPAGFTYDPGKIEFTGSGARLKALANDASRFPTGRVTLETSGGKPFAALESFNDTKGADTPVGAIKYQLSFDGSRWFYHNGKRWAPAQTNSDQANTAEEVHQHIASFHTEAGAGNLFWRAWFVSPTGKEQVELKRVDIGIIAAPMDFWD